VDSQIYSIKLLSNPENIQFTQYQNCTEASSNEFSQQMNSHILDHPEAMLIGSISIKEDNIDLILLVLAKFRKWAHIMMKEAAAKLVKHKPMTMRLISKTVKHRHQWHVMH
jgi:hypothetical protein